MADYKGKNGWAYGSIGNYYGKNLAVPECSNCKFLKTESGTYGGFAGFPGGDSTYKYKCSADTGCAASKMGQGEMVDKCKSFKEAPVQKESSGKKTKFSLGGFIIKWIIVSILATVGISIVQGGFEFQIAVGAVLGALGGWILRFIAYRILGARSANWIDKLFSIFLPLLAALFLAWFLSGGQF